MVAELQAGVPMAAVVGRVLRGIDELMRGTAELARRERVDGGPPAG